MICLSTGWQPWGSFERTLEYACRSGFDGVELHRLQQRSDIRLVRKLISAGRLHVASLHALLEPYRTVNENCAADWCSSPDPHRRSTTRRLLFDSMQFCADSGIPVVVLHGGIIPNGVPVGRYEEADAVRRAALGQQYLERLSEELSWQFERTPAVSIALECRRSPDEIPAFGELQQLFQLLQTERLGHWHDVAHSRASARVTGIARSSWLETFGNRLMGYHIQDSDPHGREHMPLGKGDDDIELTQLDPSKTWTLEVSSEHPPKDIEDSLKRMRIAHESAARRSRDGLRITLGVAERRC